MALGVNVEASGYYSHAEGYVQQHQDTILMQKDMYNSIRIYSHAEGSNTTALGQYSHAEGFKVEARGMYSHAEGFLTEALGTISHVEGKQTIAKGDYQHVQGKYNVIDEVGSMPYRRRWNK